MDTRITVVSDTHCRQAEIVLPRGDLLIHCGDMFNLFEASQPLAAMDRWFGKARFSQVLCTGGNHDRGLETALGRTPQPLSNAHFLSDAGFAFRGLSIYGAPWVPDLPRHAFYKDRPAIAAAWAKIPAGIDILVTHTPPRGILDMSSNGRSYGCAALAAELERIAPRVHCFGHVHAGAGHVRIGETLFINASSIESGTGRVLPPVTFTMTSGG